MADAPDAKAATSAGGRVAALLKLTRFPLVFTAIADSAAGYLITLPAPYKPEALTLALLAAASACLYASGMVFNDVADYLRDRVLHPERPLPSKRVSMAGARRFGLILMFAAGLFGCLLNFMSGQAVLAVLVLIFAYNFYAKASAVAGSLAMGLVRAANLTLGCLAVSPPWLGAVVVPPWDRAGYAHALLLGGYVFFLTMLSTLEEKKVDRGVFLFCTVAMAGAPALSLVLARSPAAIASACVLGALLLVHALASLRSLDRAAVMRNVRWGVLAIIALDATFVMGKAGWREGLAVLALALPALLLLPLFRRL